VSGEAPGRDLQAEQDYAEFTGWLEAQGYNPDPDMVCGGGDMRDAFFAGMQAARDLDDATLAAEVRAGHVRIETPAQAAVAGTATFHDGCTAVITGLEADREGLRTLAAKILAAYDAATVFDRTPEDEAEIIGWRVSLGVREDDGEPE
jgi:hypothetical protein